MSFIKNISLSLITFISVVKVSASSALCLTPNSHVKMFASSFRSGILERAQNIALDKTNFKNSESIHAENDLDLINKITHSFESGCKILVGLYTSKECLLIGPIAKKNNAIIISPTCGHPDIEQFNGNIFTLVPSLETYMNFVSKALSDEDKKDKDMLVIFQPSDLFSNKSYLLFKSKYMGNIKSLRLNSDGDFYKEDLNLLAQKYTTIHILTYPIVAAKALTELNNKKFISKDMTLIGSSSWAFDTTVLSKYIDIVKIFNRSLVPTLMKQETLTSSDFYKEYSKKYNEPPLGIHFMGFDAVNISKECLVKTINKKIDHTLIKKCLIENKFNGVSGKLNFNNKTPFVSREIYLTNLTKMLQMQD